MLSASFSFGPHRKIMSRTVPQYGAGPRRNGNPDLGGNLRLQGTTRSIVAVSRGLANRLNMSYAIVAHDSYSAIDLPASPVFNLLYFPTSRGNRQNLADGTFLDGTTREYRATENVLGWFIRWTNRSFSYQ